ncbi:MAG: hypothetical protein ACE5ED_13245 [Rhodothalassiaceae bacterium]
MAETEDATTTEEEEPKKKGVGLIVLIAGIIGGLAIGGGAVYFLTRGGGEQATASGEEQAAPVEEEAGQEKEPAADLLIVRARRVAVPMIDGDLNVVGYMWVDLAFETDGPANQSYVSARVPALRDAFLRDLHSRRTTRTDRPGALDFDLVHERLEAATKATLGEGRVLAVRIVNAQRVPD